MTSSGAIGYRSTGVTRAFLKLALLQHWEGRCAWCTNTIADTSSFELDHVISQAKFASTVCNKPDLGLNFDVDDVENLAPLCVGRRCNQKKNDALDIYSGAILEILHRSRQMADRIRASVAHMQGARGLEKAVLQVLAADLTEPRVKELLGAYGTNLVGRLYRVDPGIVESATTDWPMWQENRSILNFACHDDITVVVDANLDSSGRAALQVARQLEKHDVNLGRLLVDGAERIGPKLDKRLAHRGAPEMHPRVEGRSLAFAFRRRSLEFVMDSYAHRSYLVSSDYEGDRRFIVAGVFDIRVKVRLDGTWATKTSVRGDPSVFTEDEWLTEEPEDYESEP